MNNTYRLVGLPVILSLVLFSSCAGTKLTSVWKDGAYQGHPRRVMVIGVTKDPANRASFETAFVRILKGRGVEAMPSYMLISADALKDRARVVTLVREQDIDTVLVMRYLDTKTVELQAPVSEGTISNTSYGNWSDFTATASSNTVPEEFAVVQTNLFDVKTEQRIWSATSETYIVGSNISLIRSYADAIIKKLTADGILPH